MTTRTDLDSYRRWVRERYPLETRWPTAEEVLDEIETEIERPTTVASDRETNSVPTALEALAAGGIMR